jgi:hypothetical protein
MPSGQLLRPSAVRVASLTAVVGADTRMVGNPMFHLRPIFKEEMDPNRAC